MEFWGLGLHVIFRVSMTCCTYSALWIFIRELCGFFGWRCVFGVSIALIDGLNVCFGLR